MLASLVESEGILSERDTQHATGMLLMLGGEVGPNLGDTSLLHVPGRSGFAGRYQGAEAIAGLVRRMRDLTAGTLLFVPTSVFASDDRMVVLVGRGSGSRDGRILDIGFAQVATLSDGRIREMWIAFDDQDQFDEFWE